MVIEVSWLVFLAASLLLILTPGQDLILVMSRSVTQGSAAGVVTAAGVSVGLVGHTLLATLGLGAVLRTSVWLFFALKLIGAGYLIYLGITMLRSRTSQLVLHNGCVRPLKRLFFDGAFSNIANPKIALFYFAFLPQFVSAGAAHPTMSLLLLGLTFAGLTFLIKGPIGFTAGVLSGWLRSRPAVVRWLYRCSGVMLVALGLRLALERRA